MKAIAVDDEALMLGALVAAIDASPDIREVVKSVTAGNNYYFITRQNNIVTAGNYRSAVAKNSCDKNIRLELNFFECLSCVAEI